MQSFFVDTWYLIALFDRYDSHSRQAARIAARLESVELVSHDGVLTEFFAAMSHGDVGGREAAVRFVRTMMRRMSVVEVKRELFLRGIDLFADRLDKHYSLVDCMSMLVMKDLGLTHVLTNDHHFRQEGFTVVNE